MRRSRNRDSKLLLILLLAAFLAVACSTSATQESGEDGDESTPTDNEYETPADNDLPIVILDGDDEPADGDIPDGDETPDGDASDGDATDGDATDGDIPDGDVPDGDVIPDGDFSPDGDRDEDPFEIDEAEPDANLCGVGDDEKTANGGRIYYGTAEPQLLDMTPGQQMALVALVTDEGGWYSNFCSGVVVAPKLVLTAAHCVHGESASGIKVAVGPDAADPDYVLSVSAIHANPDYAWEAPHDQGVLVLTQSVYSAVPELEPVPINTTPLTSALIGERVQNGGFGMTHDNSNNTQRWWVDEAVADILDGEFTVDGQGVGGVCYGDSGGPSFYDFGDGVRVIGNVSWGDESCVDVDHFSDTAADAAWIQQYAGPQPCGAVTYAGRCDGSTAVWCESDELAMENCAESDEICGETDGLFRCVPDPCGGLTWRGRCDSDEVARWCENGQIRERHCLPCEQECGYAGSALGYYCVEPGQPDGDVDGDEDSVCGDLTYFGCCDGNTALWCGSDSIQEETCSDGCGWVDDEIGYFCGGSGEDPTGTYPIECP